MRETSVEERTCVVDFINCIVSVSTLLSARIAFFCGLLAPSEGWLAADFPTNDSQWTCSWSHVSTSRREPERRKIYKFWRTGRNRNLKWKRMYSGFPRYGHFCLFIATFSPALSLWRTERRHILIANGFMLVKRNQPENRLQRKYQNLNPGDNRQKHDEGNKPCERTPRASESTSGKMSESRALKTRQKKK